MPKADHRFHCFPSQTNLVFLLVLIILSLSTSGRAISWSADTLKTQIPHPRSLWHELSGLDNFDGARHQLYASPHDSTATPLIWEAGPRGLITPVSHSSFRIDMKAIGLVASQWRPAHMPLDLLEYQPFLADQTRFRWRWETGFLVQLTGHFYLYQRTIVDSDRIIDPTARVKEYDEIEASLEVPTAVLGYRNGPLQIQVGRRWRRWGPGWSGSLVLDAAHPPADGFDLSYTAHRWSARFSFEQVDDFEGNDQAGDDKLARYLSSHRLDLQPFHQLRLGMTETALIASDGPPPLWALNPLMPWALIQQESGSPHVTANIFWALDTVWNPYSTVSLYGQFLLDDFQIDSEDRDTYPDQLGWLAGLLWRSSPPNPAGSSIGVNKAVFNLGLEYTRLSTWTYVHRDIPVRYQAWGAPLGHPTGPDSEAITGFWEWLSPHRRLRILLLARRYLKGHIDLDTDEESTGQVDLPFPSPPVTPWTQLGAIVSWCGSARVEVQGRIGWLEPTPEREQAWYTAVSLSWRFWTWQPRID